MAVLGGSKIISRAFIIGIFGQSLAVAFVALKYDAFIF
jgi:hypothetical protein